MCRKASPEPSRISTKPKPFSGLNHFTTASRQGQEMACSCAKLVRAHGTPSLSDPRPRNPDASQKRRRESHALDPLCAARSPHYQEAHSTS